MSVWRRLASYARTEPWSVSVLAALSLLGVALEVLLPWPLKLIIDHVLPGRPLPATLHGLLALPGAQSAAGLLGWLAAGLLAAFVAGQAVQLAAARWRAHLAARLQYRLAGDLFERLQELSLLYHARARKGDLAHRVAVDTGCVPTLVNGLVGSLLGSLVMLVVLLAVMWQLDRSLALVAAAVALPMGLAMRRLGPRMSERAYRQQQLEGEAWSVAEQALAALPIVQAFAREEHEEARFRRVSSRTLAAYRRLVATQLEFKLGVDGAIALGTAALMLVGGWQVLGGRTSLGTLVVFFSYLSALYAPLVDLAYLSSTFAGAAAGARRVAEVLDAEEKVCEASHARTLPRPVRGEVRLERVSFGYEPGRPVLEQVDFAVRPGETLALVGRTGAGKTTLVSLIPRLFDPWEGAVLLDGENVRAATLGSLRANIALVLQDPFVLPVSIAENIAYGRPGASRSDIAAAAEAANADEFIRRLPRGYDELVGEGGATLSGGERQRLAIARALLRDAPVLILDEPSSALDAATEARVMQAIERLTRGRTTIVIAHRLSTVRRADRVVVLEAGRIIESGRHDELLARGGRYRELHMAAFRR